ncbi:sigma 54-interacting transcriptional regulator [bacterium]|nr:sigma 54-interacting transcriptional regulator [bacterium]
MIKALEQTSEILDSLSEGVITIDKNFMITFVNRAAEIFMGIERENAVGLSCRNVCKSEFCDTECPITQVIKTDRNLYSYNSRMLCSKGNAIPVKLNAAVIRNRNNEPQGGVLSFQAPSTQFNTGTIQFDFCDLIGRSKLMRDIFELIDEISHSDASVLIQGETGTGKELIANAIQQKSQRRNKPFVKINCAVIPQQLLGSELFGHVKGAFTDAKSDRVGRFELADGGTIFLDEIGEMPLNMQTQLLRVIQNGSFERLGESKTRKVDVRIIAATNTLIETEIDNKQFRSDLFFRLNVIPIQVPPLRDRKVDLPYLFDHFINIYNSVYKKNILEIDTDALEILLDYDWPGNIREVENVIEYAFIRSKKNKSICICGLPPALRSKVRCSEEFDTQRYSTRKSENLLSLLERNNWNQSKVAEILGVHRTTVWRKLKAMQSD